MSTTLTALQRHLKIPSPIGDWLLTTDETRVLDLSYLGPEPNGQELPAAVCEQPESRLEQRLHCMLSRYFKGEPVDFHHVPVALPDEMTFQSKVLSALRSVPYGETRHYGWLAEAVGQPGASRAVGGALGRNPFPVLIPCHRIITKSGKLGGFMQGHSDANSRVKSFLLELEGVTL